MSIAADIAVAALNSAVALVPWYVWAAIAGLLLALAWKIYKVIGWPGVAAVAAMILTFGVYRQGYHNASRAANAKKFVRDDKKGKKRRYDPDLNLWVD